MSRRKLKKLRPASAYLEDRPRTYDPQGQLAQDVRTREMMDLVTLRNRASTWWERKAIDDRFAELQRMNGGGDDA